MSLLNDALKNLKQKNQQASMHYTAQATDSEDAKLPIFKILASIVLLCLLLCIGYAAYSYWQHHKKQQALLSSAAHPTTIVSSNLLAQSIHINDLLDETQIELGFSAPPLFVTALDRINNIEKLIISNASIDTLSLCHQLGKPTHCLANGAIPLPVAPATIQSIHVAQNPDNTLTFSFKLIAPAGLQKTQLTGKNLLLIFSKRPMATDAPPPPLPGLDAGPTDQPMLQPITQNPEAKKFNLIYDNILLKRFDAAQTLISALTPTEKNSADGIMVRAKLAMAQANYTQALAILRTYSFNNSSPNPEFYALYAAALEFTNHHDEATVIYKRLVANAPNNSDWLLGLGVSAMSDHQYALAKDAFQRLISIGNLNPEIEDYIHKQLEQINIEEG